MIIDTISKEEYFRVAAEYCNIAADIASLSENSEHSEEIEATIKKKKGKMAECVYIMRDYSGAETYDDIDTMALISYPHLSREEARTEKYAKDSLLEIKHTFLEKAVQAAQIGLLCPLIMFSIDRALFGFWHTFFISLIFAPGAYVLSHLIGALFSHYLTKSASTVAYKPFSEKVSFMSKMKAHKIVAIVASIVSGLMISLCVLYF